MKKKVIKKVKYLFLFTFLKILRFSILNLKKIAHKTFRKLNLHKFNNRSFKPDPKAEKWASYNIWFGYDEFMTEAAFKIHRELVEFEGIDPKSKKYYNELDKRMYIRFKDCFSRYYSMDN